MFCLMYWAWCRLEVKADEEFVLASLQVQECCRSHLSAPATLSHPPGGGVQCRQGLPRQGRE